MRIKSLLPQDGATEALLRLNLHHSTEEIRERFHPKIPDERKLYSCLNMTAKVATQLKQQLELSGEPLVCSHVCCVDATFQ